MALYTGEYFYNSKLNNSVKNIPLWVAKYSSNKPNVPSYIGWQYSDCGIVAGISGKVDMNEFNEGILIGNGSNVQPTTQPKPQVSEWIKGIQYLCNELEIRGANGLPLQEDNLWGRNTEYACRQLPVARINNYHNDLYTR